MNGENIKQMPDIELQIVTPLKFDNCNQKLFRLCKKRVCDELNGLIGFKTDVNYKVTEALVVNDVLTVLVNVLPIASLTRSVILVFLLAVLRSSRILSKITIVALIE